MAAVLGGDGRRVRSKTLSRGVPTSASRSPPLTLASARSQSSASSTPTPAVNRFNLLLSEQKTVVRNAQEGLQHSLAILQRASSKEEQESARLQVRSLLSRAEELVLSLQIVYEIRTEMAHVQKEIQLTKTMHRDPSALHRRLLWLEQRLEKQLLARKRARPAARGRRNVAPQNNALYGEALPRPLPRRPGQLTRPGAGIKRPRAFGQAQRDARPDRTPDSPSRPSTHFSSMRCSETDSPSAFDRSPFHETSDTTPFSSPLPSTLPHPSYPQTCSPMPATTNSSRRSQSASGDSDSWHSESEANWTMVEANSSALKDIAQSQLLSSVDDDELRPSPPAEVGEGGTNTSTNISSEYPYSRRQSVTFDETLVAVYPSKTPPTIAEGDESLSKSDVEDFAQELLFDESQANSSSDKESEDLDASVYGFEPPRPVELFGPCSWNTLTLALNANLVGQAHRVDQPCSSLTPRMMQAGLEGIYKELRSLRDLVATAAQAATEPSRRVPVVGSAPPTSRRLPSGVRIKHSSVYIATPPSSSTVLRLPPLDTTSFSPIAPSRKVYTKVEQSVYPRPTNTWCHAPSHHHRALTHPRFSARPSFIRHGSRFLTPQTPRAFRRSQSSRGATGDRPGEDVFDRAGHQRRRVEYLTEETDSALTEVRRDAIQALGLLAQKSAEAKRKLCDKLQTENDPTARYLALKSLLRLDAVNAEVLKYTACYLSQGSSGLQLDLLNLLTERAGLMLEGRCVEGGWEAVEHALGQLVQDHTGDRGGEGGKEVALLAAVVLSHRQMDRDRESCVGRLTGALQHPRPRYRSLALSTMVVCWGCRNGLVISCALEQMQTLHDWHLRLAAVETLRAIGEEVLTSDAGDQQVFDRLLERLVNEPLQVVREAIGRLLTDLQLHRRATALLLGRLESPNEVTRAEAVVALGSFDFRGQIVIHKLLDYLEFDPSTSVRVQVVRLLGRLKSFNPGVVQRLVEKSGGTGLVARESAASLQRLAKQFDLQLTEE